VRPVHGLLAEGRLEAARRRRGPRGVVAAVVGVGVVGGEARAGLAEAERRHAGFEGRGGRGGGDGGKTGAAGGAGFVLVIGGFAVGAEALG